MAKVKEDNKSKASKDESKTKKQVVSKAKTTKDSSTIEFQTTLKKSHVITKSRAKLTLKMLDPKNFLKLKPKRNCTPNAEKSNWPEKCENMWDSNVFIMRNIRSCILTNKWNSLTKLLLLLYHKSGKSSFFIKQISKLNLMKNPTDSNGELLKKFLDNTKMYSKKK